MERVSPEGAATVIIPCESMPGSLELITASGSGRKKTTSRCVMGVSESEQRSVPLAVTPQND